jgi:L-lysine exporter family protein LysE/ArgO
MATGLALIVAIGSQNAFVLRQGLRQEHVLPIVAFCAVSDALLILAGIGGAGALIRGNALLLDIARFGGAAFLGAYGLLAARRAWVGGQMQVERSQGSTLGAALAACFGFTFLNPHVYLDTVVLLGSVAAQRGESGRWVFGAGAATGSLLWFTALGFGARLLAPWFEKDVSWRVLDSVIALVMGALCVGLLLGQ